GPSRARTGGLQSATLTLSQLSYGPVGGKSSGEFVVPRPIDQSLLVVARGRQTKLDGTAVHRQREWQQVAGVQVGTVRCDGVNLLCLVSPMDETVAPSTAGATTNDDDVTVAYGPLTLDAHQPRGQIENQVVTCIVERTRHDDS